MLLKEPAQLQAIESAPNRVVVVGAGAVGLYFAWKLASQGRQVVVLEAGTLDLANFPADSHRVVGRKHDGIKIGRSRTLGGTSNLWGGQLVEFQPIDLKGRPFWPNSEWPIPYEELAAYYPIAYHDMGIDSREQQDAAVWQSLSREVPDLTEGLEIFLTRWMREPNVSVLFGKDVERNPNLIVVLDSTTTGFTGENGQIREAIVKDSKGRERRIEGEAFVLAAGTFETVRLMLHAAEDENWRCPWKTNDNVGRYFQDHLGGRLATVQPIERKKLYDSFCTIVKPGHKFQPKIRTRSEVLEQTERLNIQVMFAFDSSFHENLVFLKQFLRAAIFGRKLRGMGDFFKKLSATVRHLVPLMWTYIKDHRILVPSSAKVSVVVQAEVEPLAESRITIDPSVRDAYGLPQVVLDWKLGGRELPSLHEFIQLVDKSLQTAKLGTLNIEPGLLAQDPAFLNTLRDTNHQTGGAVMGRSAKDGVVDGNLKVFDTQNLYVVGASTFRTGSNANVTFTAMALSARLADHLNKRSN